MKSLLCLLAALAMTATAAGPAPIPSKEERDRIFNLDGVGDDRVDPRTVAGTPSQVDFDVTHYLVDVDFDESALSITGRVVMTATSLVDGLTTIELDLLDNMAVASVASGFTALAHTHANDLLEITLAESFDSGESFSVTVAYSGTPLSTGFGSFGWNKYSGSPQGEAVWSLSEPFGARNWWPCKDRPDDKAIVEAWWTVRSDWTATGNGVLLAVDDLPGDRKRYRWLATHPLTTYLVSVAATDYANFSDSYTPIAGGSMPVDYYVYPEDLDDAQASFSETVPMLEFFADTFGEYPFVEDKYGMSEFPFFGAMEHSTNSSYGYVLINGSNNYDFVNAHEIAHQWWGDSVSPETWADIWLNEGFASYSEALWFEHVGGSAGYHDHMANLYRDQFLGPLYDPPVLFGVTVYNKGAWVMHMLRRVMGDTAFFQSLRQWYSSREDGTGNTAQFQANQESFHGGPLDWYFDPWVYGSGMPAYELGYTTADVGGGVFRNYVTIRQLQSVGGLYEMPIELEFVTGAGSEGFTVWNAAQLEQHFVLDTAAAPSQLKFDDEAWVLKSSLDSFTPDDADLDGVPDHADNCPAEANPAQIDLDGDLEGDACDLDDDGDGLDDGADCAPHDAEQGVPDEVPLLLLDPAGLSWSAAPRADSYDLSRGPLGGLGSGYGACLESGIAGLSHDDAAEPGPGTGFQYLVRGVDAGCGAAGPLGADSAGAPRPSPCP
jgi:aminopeptidase N